MARRPATSSTLAAAALSAGVGLVVRVAVAEAAQSARKLALRLRLHGAPTARVSVAYDADDTDAVLTAREG